MKDQVLTPLPKPFTDLFSKLLATNILAKTGKEQFQTICQNIMIIMPNVSTIQVNSSMMWTVAAMEKKGSGAHR